MFAYDDYQYTDYVRPQPNQILNTWLTTPKIVDTLLMSILPVAYPQYTLSGFGIVYQWHFFDSLSIVSIDILLDHYIVVQ